MTMRARTAGRSKKGNSLIYGWSYARVVLGTWLRERPGVDGRNGQASRAPEPDGQVSTTSLQDGGVSPAP
jgi:hypothetical protein